MVCMEGMEGGRQVVKTVLVLETVDTYLYEMASCWID